MPKTGIDLSTDLGRIHGPRCAPTAILSAVWRARAVPFGGIEIPSGREVFAIPSQVRLTPLAEDSGFGSRKKRLPSLSVSSSK